jgi:ADP-heptose:LPS heptosyltransferase
MNNLKIKFDSIYGIGDQLATIYSLENFGIQTKQKSFVCGGLAEELTGLFDLKFVSFDKNDNNSILNRNINSKAKIKTYPKNGYVHYIVRLLNYLSNLGYNHKQSVPLSLKKKKIYSNEVLCQFDSRFAKRHNFDIKKYEIKKIINMFSENNITIIGGKETVVYGNYNFFLGDIGKLAVKMASCKKFIGVDSGMSHLAGVLGIESYVVLLLPYWYAQAGLKNDNKKKYPQYENNTDVQPSLVDYYSSYRNNSCYGREVFEYII